MLAKTTDESRVVRGVLFDLDDTLNDREASWMAFIQLLAGPLGQIDRRDLHRVLAAVLLADRGGYRPKDQLFADLRDHLPWLSPLSPEAIEQLWRQHFPRCTVVRDGVRPTLLGLGHRGISTAIVTNGRTDAQQAKIAFMRIDSLIDAVVTSESVGVKKPAAAIYQAALGALGLTAAETLFVGDHPAADVAGPASLGIRTAWFARGRPWQSDGDPPDDQFDTFQEFDAVLRRAAGG